MSAILNEQFGTPKLKCRHCGFVQEYHSNKQSCPKCGKSYNEDMIRMMKGE